MDEEEEETKVDKSRPKKKEKNVFIYMASTIETQSPLDLLCKSIVDKRKIRVWTRSHSYVRSICTGYLVAFDRVFNLAMVDVDEVYKSPCLANGNEAKRKEPTENKELKKVSAQVQSLKIEKKAPTAPTQPPPTSGAKTGQSNQATTAETKERPAVKANTYRVVPELKLSTLISQKFNVFHRHINQVLIRGDNVVMVAYAD